MGPGSDDDGSGSGAVDPSLVRMLDALRRGGDVGVFRGVARADGPTGDGPTGDGPTAPAPVPAAPPALAAPDAVREQAQPPFDVAGLLPRFGVVRLASRVDVSSWGPRFWSRLTDRRRHHPPNWPGAGTDVDVDTAARVVGDGTPLVWAPRADVVAALLAADGHGQRHAVLLSREPEVLEDCRGVLAEVTHPSLAGSRWLAGRALDALSGGHPEAAQALAASVTGSATAAALRGRFAQVVQQVLLDPDLAPYTGLLRAALVPVLAAPPGNTVGTGRGDAVTAVLLTCSVLRALQELAELTECAGTAGTAPPGTVKDG